jgi:hypothetical protein
VARRVRLALIRPLDILGVDLLDAHWSSPSLKVSAPAVFGRGALI